MPFGLTRNVCSRELIGAALGGGAGGLIGSNIGKSSGRTAATVGGVLVGLFVGGAIGRSMDQLDQSCTGEVLEHVPDHQTVVWQNPQQQGYWVTPIRTYEAGDGRYCREYESDAIIAGRRQSVTGNRLPPAGRHLANHQLTRGTGALAPSHARSPSPSDPGSA